MSDNEMILTLQNDVFAAVNRSTMPLMVKSLVVENALLKLNAELSKEQMNNMAKVDLGKNHADNVAITGPSCEADEVKE